MQWIKLIAPVAAAYLLHAGPAFAEQGYKARFISSVTLGQSFIDAVNKAGGNHAERKLSAGTQIEPQTGMVYLSANKLRLDSPMSGSPAVVTTLLDFATEKYQLLDHTQRIAWVMDFSSFDQMEDEIGLPISYPEQLFCRWPDIRQHLDALRGAALRPLGVKTIANEACRGFRISSAVRDVFKADGFTLLDGVPALKEIKGAWTGEFWISQRFNLPVKMKLDFLGLEYSWELEHIESWTVVEPLLELPRGYAAKPISAEEMIHALSK